MSIRITTLGDGAMATACSIILASNGCAVTVLGRHAAQIEQMERVRENERYLPGVKVPEQVHFTTDPAAALSGCELIICAVPTQFIRAALSALAGVMPAQVPILSVSKGIENETLLRPTQILRELLHRQDADATPRRVAALSGPNIAGELARGLPAAAVVAAEEEALARQVQQLFSTRSLRAYRNPDLTGVELAGAMKNVIAVAAGMIDGLKAGNNAKASLLTRGLVEISRLGVAMGAQAETFAGLAGLGDLVTTCVSPEGRNRSFGERVGRGEKVADVLAATAGVVEGLPTTKSVVALARLHQVDMPISETLFRILFEGKHPKEGIRDLMARDPKQEGED